MKSGKQRRNGTTKNKKELETLIHAVRILSQDIGMEFGIEKCAILVMKSGKQRRNGTTKNVPY